MRKDSAVNSGACSEIFPQKMPFSSTTQTAKNIRFVNKRSSAASDPRMPHSKTDTRMKI